MTINSNITISIIAKNKRNRGINANRTFVITYDVTLTFLATISPHLTHDLTTININLNTNITIKHTLTITTTTSRTRTTNITFYHA